MIIILIFPLCDLNFYMEIMKVFSSYDDYGYEDERLYSVLMDEEEVDLFKEVMFSERKKLEKEYKKLSHETTRKLNRLITGISTGSLGLLGTGMGLGYAANSGKSLKNRLAGAGVGMAAGYGIGKLSEKLNNKAVKRGDKKFLKETNDEDLKKTINQMKQTLHKK